MRKIQDDHIGGYDWNNKLFKVMQKLEGISAIPKNVSQIHARDGHGMTLPFTLTQQIFFAFAS